MKTRVSLKYLASYCSLSPENYRCAYQRASRYLTVSAMSFNHYNSCFFEEDRSYRNNSGIRLHAGDLEHSLMKKK